ncbi:MAG: hypothetical protein WAX44_02780 [Minisyncoccia bacterium]
MKTLYKPTHIVSPFQVAKKKGYDVQDKNHPVQDEIRKIIGTYDLSATFEEDTQTLEMFRHIPGLVAFSCTLKHGAEVIGYGRGTAVLSRMNRFVERAIRTAFNGSLVDAVVKSTKMLDALRLEPGKERTSYITEEIYENEPITDRQKSYLLELVFQNIEDEDERNRWSSQIDEMTKSEASNAIQVFAKQ